MMNKLRFKLVFSKRLGMLVPIAEIARSHQKSVSISQPVVLEATTSDPSMTPLWRLAMGQAALLMAGCFALTSGALWAQDANTLPTNGNIVSGAGVINVNNNVMDVNTTTNQAVIRWDSFNIGANAGVNFNMPSTASSVLNRVMGDSASLIQGMLNSNGHVYIVNQNGIYFGAGSQINVGSLTATTLDNIANNTIENIYNQGILSNKTAPVFSFADAVGIIDVAGKEVDAQGKVVKEAAKITTTTGGRVMLLAPDVKNSGVIHAPDGQVILAAGKTIYLSTLDKFAGLLVEVSSGGTATNLGDIFVNNGNASMIGLAVNQEGRISATTTIRANGSIYLKAKSITQYESPLTDIYGDVKLGEGSRTEVSIAVNDTETVKNAQSITKSNIEITGKNIAIEGAVVANSGVINVAGKTNSGTTSIYVGDKALIDVSGVDATAPMSRNQLVIDLYSQQLNDSPILRGGALFGKKLYLDARKGTGIISQSVIDDALLSQDRTISERMTTGGTVSLVADSVVTKAGSVIDLSSGTTTYTPGNIRESRLFYNGKWINASEAVAGVPYSAINDEYSITNTRWGVTKTWSLTSAANGQYQAGYTAGADAGKYNVEATALALQGDVIATRTIGTYQRGDYAGVSTPTGGSLNINYIGSGSFNITDQVALLSEAFTRDSSLSDEQKQQSELSTHVFSQGINNFTLNASSAKVNVNGAINASASGNITIDGAAGVNVSRNITTAGGNIKLAASSTADVVLGNNVKISTAGLFTNDLPGVQGAMLSPVVTRGGNVTITDGLVMKDGARIDASSGAWVKSNGQIVSAQGGNVEVTLAQNSIADGAITSYGLGANGTQTSGGHLAVHLQGVTGTSGVKDVQLGGTNTQAANTLWLSEAFFKSGGFSQYAIDNQSNVFGSIVVGDQSGSTTVIHPEQATRFISSATSSMQSGAMLDTMTSTVMMPSFARQPVSLSLNAGNQFTLHENALLSTDAPTSLTGARGNINISSLGQMTILGDIDAPSANVTLAIKSQPGSATIPNAKFDNTLSLFVGENASISAKGSYIAPPSVDGTFRSRAVADAGNISISAENGVLILKEGSQLDVSAVSGAIDLSVNSGFSRQQVDGNAGSIRLAGRDGMALDGDLQGQASGRGAAGTLLLRLGGEDAVGVEGDNNTPLLYAAGQRLLTVTQQYQKVSDNNTPGSLTTNLIEVSDPRKPLTNAVGKAQISAQQINKGGFDNVTLRVDNVQENTASGVVFESGLTLNVPTLLTLDASSFSGPATVNTAALIITNSNATTLSNPTLGTGEMQLNADFVDVIGNVAFTNINSLQIKSTGDIRVGGIRTRSSTTGSLITPQKLVMDAAQIYPVTAHEFDIKPTGSNTVIEVKNSGNRSSQVPLSAQGKLTLTADNIIQSGTLRAPLGEINLNATEMLVLGENSRTSVSSENSLIPYLVTTLGGSRLVADKDSTQSDALPYSGKKILLNGKNVDMREGATVDISGGGDMLAYEWIQGIGGTVDVLNQSGYYAVMPSLGNQYAPYDFNMQSNSDVTLGQAIYLSGGNGLSAGKYTLLPAHYALMPGAYLVKVNGTQTPINTTLAQLDGGSLMSGYFTRLDDSSRGQFNSFSVYNGNIFTANAGTKDYKGPAEYLLTYLNDFYSKQASANNTSLTLAKDAGQLSIQALNQLELNGKITGQAVTGGRGALVDISSNRIEVVSTSVAPTSGVLTLSADQLSKIEADSVLLGGSRAVTGNQQTITTNASEVTFSNDADHGVVMKELLVTAKNEIRLEDGASVKTTERTGNSAGVNELQTDGAGAFLAISSVNDLAFDRNNATTASGNMVIGSGANLEASRSAVLDASQQLALNGDIRVGEGGSLTLGTNRFLLGDNIPAVDGTRLDQKTLLAFGDLNKLNLNSYQNIDIYGAVSLGSEQLSLTLNTSGLAHHGDGDVQIRANTLTLKNTQDGSVFNAPADAGTSNLVLNTKNTVLGATKSVKGNQQRFDVQGFETVNINAQEAITTAGTGQLEVKANQTQLSAAKITAETGSTYAVNASGSLVTSANGSALAETTGIGGKLSLTAAQTTINNTVELLAGQFNATSTNGDLKLGASGKIITRSATVQFDQTHAKTTDAGDVSLTSNTGNVDIAQNALIDVSGGSQQGEAGRLTVNAKNGEFLVADGSLKGSASANERAGEFALDVKSLSNFSAVNQALETGQFNQSRDIRVRMGDVNVQAGDTVTANTFILGVDAGDANIAGAINADGNKGGNVEIYANGLVKLANTAKITARGHQTNQSTGDLQTGSGGDVLLSSNSLSTTNAVSADAGAIIDVSGYDKTANNNVGVDGADGSVTLRGQRGTTGTANTVNVAFNSTGAIKGASEVRVEGVKTYTSATFDNSIAGLVTDTNSFYDANPNAGSYANTQDGLAARVLPHIEIRSTGNMTSNADQNLRAFGNLQVGKGGTLTLRSSGDLSLNGTLSDGFSTTTTAGILQANTQTFNFNMIAGADYTAANQGATLAGIGNFSLANGKMVRTGEGDITVVAGNNIELAANANIYTLGKTVSNIDGFTAPRTAESSRDRNAYNVNGSYVNNGGDIALHAGNNISGVLSGQTVNEWLSRQGSTTADTSWWIRADLFNQGVAALAGGHVNISAGNNISNLSVSSATNAQYDTAGTGATGNSVVNGGGDLNIQAGGSLTNGIYYSGRGSINIRVDGDIQKTGNTGTAIALQDAQADVRARGSALIETVYNPTLWMQNVKVTTGNNLTFFNTYTDNSAFNVTALLGNLTIGQNDPGSLNNGTLFNDADNSLDAVTKNDMAAIHPGLVNATAFAGGITVNKIIVAPSANGGLSLLANSDIVGAVSSVGRDKPVAQILVSNADSTNNLTIKNPFSGKPADNLELFGDLKYGNKLSSVNTGTSNSVVIISKTGDINLPGDPPATLAAEAAGSGAFGLKSSMPAYISAAKNLTLNASIQHNNQDDVSYLKAGNDIVMKANQPLAKIEVNGPGDLIVQAGRDINLGNSAGILSRANNVNPNLPTNGANITVLAGVGEKGADIAGFISLYIDPQGRGPLSLQDASALNDYRSKVNAIVQTYMEKITQKSLTVVEAMQLYLALDTEKQAPLVYDVFSKEMVFAIKDYVQTANTERGDAVINGLFPSQNSYSGNISMYQSQIVTARDGNINLLLPGGLLNAGVAADSENLPHGIGIITERGGYINVYADKGFEVNQSKVKSLYGGDLIAWVNNGDIDAGRGSKTAVSIPERIINIDNQGNVVVEVKGVASGSGLATETYDPDGPNGSQTAPKAGTVYLAAPRGALDAGEAGVSSGADLFIGAQVINNATNITAAGASSGVPVADTGSLAGAALSATSTAAGVSNNMTDNLANQMNNQNVAPKELPAIVTVKTIRLED
ncbi:filamentous haemagglutinin family protein [Methylophilus aquaticus]|uniref:Filamentous hemagglutinin family protein n=1 Tax=Methylophilus aquaticus TaxID=1971610 RepID=A0ABT9JUE1_9PROT|nr:filamentous haemagglutinin family protein [Methylophilus aquaticus]MDP8568202.1 filamentous hemagglutinin family protein [Methylophilus aquaticus]